MPQETVLIAGFGGQGILLVGQLLAESAMRAGLNATWFPSYGPEMRGGTANCTTIYSEDEIGSPIAAVYDAVIVMNQPSLEKFGPMVRSGGCLMIDSTMTPIRWEQEDCVVLHVPAGKLAHASGIDRAANVVMLGAYLAVRPQLSISVVETAIRDIVGRKRPEAIEPNIRALHAGMEAASEFTCEV